jgi:hypothetical protein
VLPERTAYHKRRRLSGAIEAPITEFARHSPGFYDDIALVDSAPVECARSVETIRTLGLRFAGEDERSGALRASPSAGPTTRRSAADRFRGAWRGGAGLRGIAPPPSASPPP